MPNLNTKPLGELCQLINGRAFKPTDWGKSGLPIVRIQNLNDESKPFNYYEGEYRDTHFIDSGEILLSWSGTPGTSFGCFRWNRGPAILNQHIFKVLPTEEMDGDFFIHAVNSKLDEMIGQAHGGVGLRHITKGKLEAIRLPLRELSLQRKVAASIDACFYRIDEIVRLRRESINQVKAIAPSLYASICESPHFERKTVGEVVSRMRNGKSIRQDNENGNGYVLSLSAVHDISLSVANPKAIVLPDPIAQQYQIREGDVFVSRSNTRELVGLSSVATSTPAERLIYPDLLIKLETDPEIITPRYLAYALRTSESRRQIKDRAVGSSQTMVKISGERLRQVSIPVPTLAEQNAMVSRLDEVHGLTRGLAVEMDTSEQSCLRDAVLRKAFAGGL